MKKHAIILAAIASVFMASCEKITMMDEPIGEGTACLNISVNRFEYLPFDTRGTLTPADVSKRLSFAIFDMNGERVMTTKSQTSSDSNYGSLKVNLKPGRYVLVTVAHNGDNNCTISSPTEVKFVNNKVTDTFTSCDTLSLEEGEQTARITMRRRVAMIRLLLDETLPEEVETVKFYYIGGSSTFNANEGYGCVNSRQTEILSVPSEAHQTTGCTFDVYTFPHADRDTLKITITAQNAHGEALYSRELVDVPIKVGQITQMRGTLTGHDNPGMDLQLEVADADWTQDNYAF